MSEENIVGNSLWKSVSTPPEEHSISARQKSVADQFEKWKKNPNGIRKTFLILLGIPLLFYGPLLFSEWYREIFSKLFFHNDLTIVLAMIPGLPVFLYLGYIKRTQVDVLKMIIADKFGWKYDPTERESDWSNAARTLPEAFQKGNCDQNLQDQFWGEFEGSPFWAAVFHYGVERRNSKGQRSVSYYHQHFFAFQIPKSLTTSFMLKPDDSFFKFGSRDIDTESEKFNEMFEVSYSGEKDSKQLEIIKTLSPSVITRLTDIGDQNGKYWLYLKKDIALFMFKDKMVKSMETNFLLHGVKLDPRDQHKLESRMKMMLDASTELLPYLS